jgi:pimeloyl-ACP methyl ester carboxylesterase
MTETSLSTEAALGPLRTVRAGVLDVAFHESGPENGPAVFLLHGLPYDVQAYVEVAPLLAARGNRVIVPFLRGFGPTRFVAAATPRSGEQAALGSDLLTLMDALGIERALFAGYDWGGTAACAAAALSPERCTGLVSLNGYKLQNMEATKRPIAPEDEVGLWYQYYFLSERGRTGLDVNRHALCSLMWRMWSPTWNFDHATYARTAPSLDNPDFVDVVIHSYRHRNGAADGAAEYASLAAQLDQQPNIPVPTISLDGSDDGVMPARGTPYLPDHFTGPYEHRVVAGAGHNLPQEKPQAFVDAVCDILDGKLSPSL